MAADGAIQALLACVADHGFFKVEVEVDRRLDFALGIAGQRPVTGDAKPAPVHAPKLSPTAASDPKTAKDLDSKTLDVKTPDPTASDPKTSNTTEAKQDPKPGTDAGTKQGPAKDGNSAATGKVKENKKAQTPKAPAATKPEKPAAAKADKPAGRLN